MIGIKMNLGLGDAIAMSPIIMDIASKTTDTVQIQSYPHNMVSVKSIFANIKNIEVVSDNVPIEETYKFGWYGDPPLENEYFVDWFYRQYGADRNLPSPILKASERVLQLDGGNVFIHDKEGMRINREGFRPIEEGSILRYVEALLNADEIHVIDSSFLHLVEELPVKGKLFFHNIREGSKNSIFNFKHNWNVNI